MDADSKRIWMTDQRTDELAAWIIDAGLIGMPRMAFLEAYCEKLVAAGVPLAAVGPSSPPQEDREMKQSESMRPRAANSWVRRVAKDTPPKVVSSRAPRPACHEPDKDSTVLSASLPDLPSLASGPGDVTLVTLLGCEQRPRAREWTSRVSSRRSSGCRVPSSA